MRQISLISSGRRTKSLRARMSLHGRVYSGSSTLHAPAASESVQGRVTSCHFDRQSCATRLAVSSALGVSGSVYAARTFRLSKRGWFSFLSLSPEPQDPLRSVRANWEQGQDDRLPTVWDEARAPTHETESGEKRVKRTRISQFPIRLLGRGLGLAGGGGALTEAGRGGAQGKSADEVTTTNSDGWCRAGKQTDPFLKRRETCFMYCMRPVPVVCRRFAFCPHSSVVAIFREFRQQGGHKLVAAAQGQKNRNVHDRSLAAG